jgi:ketosteroid isomerase-like protein
MVVLFAFIPAFACAATPSDNEKIHEELRRALNVIETAINTGHYDDMLPVLSENIRATPINQEFLSSRAEVSAYFQKWFGKDGYLKKLEFKLTPDAPTEISADKRWGLVQGSGIEKYVLSDTRYYELKTRWSAVLAKEADGKWRVRSLHVGTDFLNNPILDEAGQAVGKAAAMSGGICLVLGLALGWLLFRKKKS